MTSSSILENLIIPAIVTDVIWVLSNLANERVLQDEAKDIEDLRAALELIKLFEAAHVAYEHGGTMLPLEQRQVRNIRTTFFVERVTLGQLGYEAWNLEVEKALLAFIQSIVNTSEVVKSALQGYIDGVQLSTVQLEVCREFFEGIAAAAHRPQ